MYYDIHCHLDSYENPEEVVKRAEEAGIKLIITNGTNLETNRTTLDLANKFPIVKPALGVYPTDALELSEEQLEEEIDFVSKQDISAIGEVGLDYHHIPDKQEEMKVVFEKFIQLAEKMKKPLLVHSRKAEADVIDILSTSKATFDLHCFGGNLKLVKKGVDAGAYFSIPATIVKATHFQRIVEEVPSDKLLTETDAPWLSPDDSQNEPSNIPLIVKKIAELKQLDLEECKNQLWFNAQRFLN